jgi:predicted nuclease with TOPRIM domain
MKGWLMFGRNQTAQLPASFLDIRSRFASQLKRRNELLERRLEMIASLKDMNAKLEALPSERKSISDSHYYALLAAAKDPTKQSGAEECEQRLRALDAEHVHLTETRDVAERELPIVEKTLDGVQVELERQRACLWEEVLSALVAKAPPGIPEWLSKTCAAAQLVQRGNPVHLVLGRIGWPPPDGRELSHYIAELRKEFSLPHE